MTAVFALALLFALGAVATVLGLGIINLLNARRSTTPEQELQRAKRSNKLMQWRVILQGLALAILFVAFLAAHHQ